MHSYSTVIQSIASGVGTAFIIYISVALRKGLRKFMGEHDWLMNQVKDNTTEIKRLLTLQEARDRQQRRAR